MSSRREHWEDVYRSKSDSELSWTQDDPRTSLALIRQVCPGPGAVIDTSFTMDYGETVVVGTSRLQGSKALIVLLTAVAK